MFDSLLSRNDRLEKKILSIIFSCSLSGVCTEDILAEELNFSKERVSEMIKELSARGLISVKEGKLFLTEDGRRSIKVVMTGGVFDIIHRGHIYTLKKAKSLGDVLVVSVARDKIVRKLRGELPMNSESDRAELVRSIRYVDAAVLGSEEDPLGAMYDVKPDIVAIGYDQKHDESEIKQKAEEKGMKLVVVRLDSPLPDMKTTKIKEQKDVMNSL